MKKDRTVRADHLKMFDKAEIRILSVERAARHQNGPAEFLAFQLGRCEDAVKVIPVKDVSRMTVSFNANYGLLPVTSVFGWTDKPVPLEKLPPGPVQRKLL